MVKPKKYLGQHFLNDQNIANKIAGLIGNEHKVVCELGPGTGILTRALLKNSTIEHLKLVEIDAESVEFLEIHFDDERLTITQTDFLEYDLSLINKNTFSLVGNFPYNISSQIFFKVLEYHDLVTEVVCMIQKEVAERIVAPPGNKTYGILSVLLQSWYDIEYCFTVSEHVFIPPPKVKSAVIRLTRNRTKKLDCDEKLFFRLVKMDFNQRIKTLKNALKTMLPEYVANIPFLDKRAEQLSTDQFIELTKGIETS